MISMSASASWPTCREKGTRVELKIISGLAATVGSRISAESRLGRVSARGITTYAVETGSQ